MWCAPASPGPTLHAALHFRPAGAYIMGSPCLIMGAMYGTIQPGGHGVKHGCISGQTVLHAVPVLAGQDQHSTGSRLVGVATGTGMLGEKERGGEEEGFSGLAPAHRLAQCCGCALCSV